jgi:hypothetical protein
MVTIVKGGLSASFEKRADGIATTARIIEKGKE